MKLTLEQIKSVTVGALSVWEEDGAYRFAKCTQKQIEAWYKERKDLGERAEATTGVRLDFHTNSKSFSYTSKTVGNYEIYIDDVFTHAYFKKDIEECNHIAISLDGEEHRITLYLPSHDIPGSIYNVEIDDGSSMKPHQFACKMLFIGDSITQGWESTWDSLSYAYHVSRFYNAESVIQGIGGAYFHEGTFDADIDFDPDIVIVAYGTNDWGHFKTITEGKEHCKKFLEQLVAKYGDKKVFGISPIWRGDADSRVTSLGRFEEWTSYIKNEIQKQGITLIAGETLTPHLPAFYSDEYLHPDTKGFGIYALNLIAQLQKYL